MKKILKLFIFLAMILGIASCGNPEPVGITISATDNVRIIHENETLQLEAKVYPEKAKQEVLWSTSDTTVATVNEQGLVTGVSVGNVDIIAKAKANEEISQKYALIVEIGEEEVVDPESITLTSLNNVTTLKAGTTLELSASILPAEASQTVIWTSSDVSVATVTRGVVKGIKEGKVTITASPKDFDSIKATIELTIEKNDNPELTQDWATMSYSNHDQYINNDDSTALKVKGVVTQVINNETTINYFLQNGKDGYYIFGQDVSLGNIEVGKVYEVGGFKLNKPAKQITNVEYVKELNETITSEVNSLVNVDSSNLNAMLPFHGSLVTCEAVVEKLSVNTSKAYNFTAKVNGYSTTFRVDATYSNAAEVAKINEVLSGLAVGMKFEFEGLALCYGSGTQKPQIQLFDATKVKQSELPADEYLRLVADKIQIPASLGFTATSVNLSTKLDGFDDVTISWASSDNVTINSQTGVVTHSSEKVTVKLTATLTYKGVTVTKEFNVDVAPLDNNTYETVVSVDFEDCKAENPTVSYSDSIKPGYDAAVVNIGAPKANWLLDNALIDGQSNDVIEGEYGIRAYASNGARIEIQQDGEYNVIELEAAIYGTNPLGAQIKVEYSLDSGVTWTEDDEFATIYSRELEAFRFKLPEGAKRVAIVVVPETGNRVNIDNIKLMK